MFPTSKFQKALKPSWVAKIGSGSSFPKVMRSYSVCIFARDRFALRVVGPAPPPQIHHGLDVRTIPAYVVAELPSAVAMGSTSSEVFCGAVPHMARESFWRSDAIAVSSFTFTMSNTAVG